MRDNLNIDLVFPIRGEVSAWLMCLKADLLYDAGVINDNELNDVIERAAAAIDQSEKVAGEPPHTPIWRPEWNERRRGFPWDHERPGDEVRDLTGKSRQVRQMPPVPGGFAEEDDHSGFSQQEETR